MTSNFAYIPNTVSDEWAEHLRLYPDPLTYPPLPQKEDIKGWLEIQSQLEKEAIESQKELLKKLNPTLKRREIAGVKVLEIIPTTLKREDAAIIYIHGGAYTLMSAESTLSTSLPLSHASGLRTIAIDYTLAPFASWIEIQDEVLRVIKGVVKEGTKMEKTVLFGDSAGGGMAGGITHRLIDEGVNPPRALVLWSPWSDITDSGDSYETLKNAEPLYSYERHLKPAALAYAPEHEHKNPYISPVYGSFDKRFPPTLIQGGTKEIFLSNFVRLYRALEDAGVDVKLDLYEGIVHVFQAKLPNAPESRTAIKKSVEFLEKIIF